MIFVDQKLSGTRREDIVLDIQLPTLTLQFPLLILWLAGVTKDMAKSKFNVEHNCFFTLFLSPLCERWEGITFGMDISDAPSLEELL